MRKYFRFIIPLLFVIATSEGLFAKDQYDMSKYLPDVLELKGWQAEDIPYQAEGEELFSLINGAAEVHLEYGFTRVIMQTYINKNEQFINLEIFEMQDPAAAYGLYTFQIGEPGQAVEIGNEGLLEEYYLNFWKGSFLVTVSGDDSEKETLDAIEKIAKNVEAKIQSQGERPQLVELLFEALSIPSRIKYIKGDIGLFNWSGFDSGSIVGFKEGVIGRYDDMTVLLFVYPSENECTAGFEHSAHIFQTNSLFTDFSLQNNTFSFFNDERKEVYGEISHNVLCLISGKKQSEAAEICEKITKKAITMEGWKDGNF